MRYLTSILELPSFSFSLNGTSDIGDSDDQQSIQDEIGGRSELLCTCHLEGLNAVLKELGLTSEARLRKVIESHFVDVNGLDFLCLSTLNLFHRCNSMRTQRNQQLLETLIQRLIQ